MAAVLKRLGAKATPENLAFMYAWARAEGTSARYNPLATTKSGYKGETRFNSVGVKNYPSFAAGVAATVDTLRHYHVVVQALKANAAASIVQTPAGRADLNMWVHGTRGDTSVSGYVRNISGGIGVAAPPSINTAGGDTAPAAAPAQPPADTAAVAAAPDTPTPLGIGPDPAAITLGPQINPPGTVQADGYAPSQVAQLWQQVAGVQNPSPETLQIASLHA